MTVEQRAVEGSTEQVSILKGTGAVFNDISVPMILLLDSGERVEFVEVIHPEAVVGCDMTDVVCCIDHTESRLLGRTPLTLRLNVDTRGIHFECDLPPLPISHEIRVYVSRRDIRGCSFRFKVIKDRWEVMPGGQVVRHVLKISRILDVGPVVRPVYPQTNVAARSYSDAQLTTIGETGEGLVLPPPIANNQMEKRSRQLLLNERSLTLLQR